MRNRLSRTLLALSSLCISVGALAQSGEIRVLLANHPYGDLLKQSIPQFEKSTGIKVNVESLQESQLTQKLDYAVGNILRQGAEPREALDRARRETVQQIREAEKTFAR